MVTKGKDKKCCPHGHSLLFPLSIFGVGLLWALSDMKMITLELPWLPILVMMFGLVKFFHMKNCCK